MAATAAPTAGAEGRVDPQHPLWKLAVDSMLVKLVDSETQVRVAGCVLVGWGGPLSFRLGGVAACWGCPLSFKSGGWLGWQGGSL